MVLEDGCFLNTMNARQVDTLMGKAYKSWQSAQFFGFMKRFGIDERKKIKDYSKGMRMKISIAAALSHGAELLIMDEPTSGLDPVVRDEVLDLFYNFMQGRVARDPAVQPHHERPGQNRGLYHLHPSGPHRALRARDELLDTYGVLRCTADQLASLDPAAVRAKRVSTFGLRGAGAPRRRAAELAGRAGQH